jgi:DNA-binding NtrC family response regulator
MNTKTTILIIDDDQDFFKLINIVRIERILIECVHAIREAGKILTVRNPGFILLDNNLPKGKDIDFLQERNSLFTQSRVL